MATQDYGDAMNSVEATAAVAPRRNSSGLRRDLELLEILGSPESESAGGLGVVRVAELAGRDKGGVSRTLATLAESGLVSRDPITQSYRLGYQLYALAARTLESRLVRASAPFLRRVVTAIHETTHLCVLRGGSVLTLASELSELAFRGLGWEGVSTAAWQTSSGRVLVSDWAEHDLRGWYALHGHDEPVTSPFTSVAQTAGASAAARTDVMPLVTDFDSLWAEISLIRRRGYAIVDEEFEKGVVGVSAPVFDFRGTIIAAINVSAPKTRLGGRFGEAGMLTARVAAELSAQLGALPRSMNR
ncbi:IclR family transcriptional regulator [Frigoribacterium sp. CG_9.8]|uniref:IclR family transcriptional regulator n=1 Tax=Frigoribacterium sp. CG_9.8 TaxID=2787733 RepID=UPI001A32371E|nr:IclR family transcriptional regulator [Frigoribacterium sp. CG_9.8]MBG6107013.1 DNA-binding IclR family transcriptional regulator [Frigoribacterium sp. CG_9.8]